MTDDTDDKLADPAQVAPVSITHEDVGSGFDPGAVGYERQGRAREPRTAVDAASDPAHGGGMPIISDDDLQSAALGSPTPRMFGVDPPKAGAPRRTIMSGVERIKAAVSTAEGVMGEFEDFVALIGGDAVQADKSQAMQGTTTVDLVHFAASLVERVGEHVADLLQRAKAAHG